jgi:putative ABC transport system permease protein
MIKNYLLITFRSLMKNKLFIFINIFGMGISIACCIVAYFNYDYNVSFDSNHLQAPTIYRVGCNRVFQNEQKEYGFAQIALGNVIKQNVPDVQAVVRYSQGSSSFRVGTDLFSERVLYVDRPFFNLFTYEFIDGDGALKDKSQICISDELAMKYFRTDHAVGKPITQMLDSGRTKEYVIAGVFKKQPDNSSFSNNQMFSQYDNLFEFDHSLSENSWRYRTTIFIQITDPSRLKVIQDQIDPYVENNNKIREDFILKNWVIESFVGMGARDGYSDKPGTWTHSGSPIAAVVGIGVMGIFVLLIACFNLTNTAVAISSRRLKEIGLRKVMGSSRWSLIAQFIGETTLICFSALIVGLLLAEYALIPAFNALWSDLKIVTNYWGSPNFVMFIIGTLVFVSLLAGGYPAFYISKFQPTSILKGTMKFGGTNYFTRTLLTLQFIISLIAIVSSIAFIDNAKFQKSFDLGFNKDGIIYTYVNNRSEYETYRNALLENHEITSIAGSQHHLYSYSINDPIKHEDKEIEVDILDVGEDYLPVMGLKFKEGRNFETDSENDRKESVIITEGLARKLDMKEPIGKEIIWMDTVKYYVVGVVNDVYNRGLWEQMEPVMFRYGPKDKVGHILVRVPADKLTATNKFMEAKWKEIFPNRLYNGRFMDDEMVEANTINNNVLVMFIFLGAIALILSATGLFTLVSLNIIKKMKEIGVRKVLGASVGNLARVINTEFIIILLIASILGGYAGAALSGMLMSSIWKYYQEATLITMVLSAVILLITCVLSIGFKVYNTTRLNPANVLRDE